MFVNTNLYINIRSERFLAFDTAYNRRTFRIDMFKHLSGLHNASNYLSHGLFKNMDLDLTAGAGSIAFTPLPTNP